MENVSPDLVKDILNSSFWLDTINTKDTYVRFEDDSPKGKISIAFSDDGDAWIIVLQDYDPNDFGLSARFRIPMSGGGQSPRVRNALLILAEAIRLDNIDREQHR